MSAGGLVCPALDVGSLGPPWSPGAVSRVSSGRCGHGRCRNPRRRIGWGRVPRRAGRGRSIHPVARPDAECRRAERELANPYPTPPSGRRSRLQDLKPQVPPSGHAFECFGPTGMLPPVLFTGDRADRSIYARRANRAVCLRRAGRRPDRLRATAEVTHERLDAAQAVQAEWPVGPAVITGGPGDDSIQRTAAVVRLPRIFRRKALVTAVHCTGVC